MSSEKGRGMLRSFVRLLYQSTPAEFRSAYRLAESVERLRAAHEAVGLLGARRDRSRRNGLRVRGAAAVELPRPRQRKAAVTPLCCHAARCFHFLPIPAVTESTRQRNVGAMIID